MIERNRELNRHYHRREKLQKLRKRLANAKSEAERLAILAKIHSISPRWTEAPKA